MGLCSLLGRKFQGCKIKGRCPREKNHGTLLIRGINVTWAGQPNSGNRRREFLKTSENEKRSFQRPVLEAGKEFLRRKRIPDARKKLVSNF